MIAALAWGLRTNADVHHPGVVDVVEYRVAPVSTRPSSRRRSDAPIIGGALTPAAPRIQSATSGRYLKGMLLQTCVPSS